MAEIVDKVQVHIVHDDCIDSIVQLSLIRAITKFNVENSTTIGCLSTLFDRVAVTVPDEFHKPELSILKLAIRINWLI